MADRGQICEKISILSLRTDKLKYRLEIYSLISCFLKSLDKEGYLGYKYGDRVVQEDTLYSIVVDTGWGYMYRKYNKEVLLNLIKSSLYIVMFRDDGLTTAHRVNKNYRKEIGAELKEIKGVTAELNRELLSEDEMRHYRLNKILKNE